MGKRVGSDFQRATPPGKLKNWKTGGPRAPAEPGRISGFRPHPYGNLKNWKPDARPSRPARISAFHPPAQRPWLIPSKPLKGIECVGSRPAIQDTLRGGRKAEKLKICPPGDTGDGPAVFRISVFRPCHGAPGKLEICLPAFQIYRF